MEHLIQRGATVRSSVWKGILAKQYRDKLKAMVTPLSFSCSWMYVEGLLHSVARLLYTYPHIKFYVN